ncbi:MAG: sulfotransferase [Novosphingobium sp.]|nr:sulfotransferase [Novosphingobium sp.]
MGLQLSAAQIIDSAMAATGLSDFGGDSFREGLEILITDTNADSGRPDEKLEMNIGMYTKILIDRLNVTEAIKQRPEVLDAPTPRPLFVFGIPRTGTTLLSNLLAADPARRSPLTWELNDPVPPPTTDTLYTDPRALAALEAEREMLKANPGINKIYRMSAIYPYECVSIMAHDFRTLMLESAGKLPNYRDFVFESDWGPAYDYHRKFLQLHQADAPGIWNLKMPSHALKLETLLKFYPDARLIWAHRDPYTATGSFCSIITSGHSNFTGQVDLEWIGENMPWQAREHVDRIMDVRGRIGHDRIVDSHYAALMRDPLEYMRDLYARLGDDFTLEAEAAMQAWLDDNPQGKFGKHEYKLAQYGLSKAKLEPLFERYLSEYDVEPEG